MRQRDLETAAWTWLPPVAFAAALALLWITGTNEAWFHRINGWSYVTGPRVWADVTIFGDALVLLGLALPILWYRPRWAWGLVAAALITTLVTHTIKPWLAMPRPAAVLGADAITIIGPVLRAKAMPSGHAAAALTLAGALVPLIKSRSARFIILSVAVLVAVSRVVVGAHWPVDVMAGALIGWLSGMISLRLMGDRKWMTNRAAVSVLTLIFAGCAIDLFFMRSGYPGTYALQACVAVVSLGFVVPIVRRSWSPMTET